MATECALYLHVGPPRTATTTLQKHFLPSIKHYLCLQKRAFRPHSVAAQDEGLQVTKGGYILDFRQTVFQLEDLQNRDLASASARDLLFLIINAVGDVLCRRELQGRRRWNQLLSQALKQAARGVVCDSQYNGIVIASESLSNTPLGLTGSLSKISDRITLPTQVICDTWKASAEGQVPCISFCLREPEEYILSRYMRYLVDTMMRGEDQETLSVEGWLNKQVRVHRLKPWGSALFPAFHKSFIRYHARHGFVRPYGFRELLASDDVYDLIGFSGEKKVAFNEFPKENSFHTLMDVAFSAKERIHKLLNKMQLLSLLHQEQLFE